MCAQDLMCMHSPAAISRVSSGCLSPMHLTGQDCSLIHCCGGPFHQIATYRVHTVERPAGEEEWGLYRSASLGQTVRQWPLSGQPVVPFLPCEGCSMGQGYSLPAGRCLRAASQKMEGAAKAACSGNATTLAAAVAAAADGVLTSGKTCDAALMSPFDDTSIKVAAGCREATMQPLTRISRHMSLDPAGCKRDSVKTWWRSLSFDDPGASSSSLPRLFL